ncbi:hypothetical protein AOLI_G00324860 [Acnodon oligacanthus]
MALKESNSEDVHMSSVSASAHYLRTSFGLTDDVLNQIRTEVTAVLRTLALERKDVLSTKAAVTFTSTLLDDLLDQRNSPCGDLTPRNQLDPDFFFIIEVSNKETASSPFCEYTLLFELHVHGFPLDPVRGLFFMQFPDDHDSHSDHPEGHKQCKTGDVIVKTGQTLYSCFLQLYRIIFRIV